MTHRPLFFQRVLRSLCVTKARKCHHMRQRRYNCRFREPYARQKRKKIKWLTCQARVTSCHWTHKGCPKELLSTEQLQYLGIGTFGCTYRKWWRTPSTYAQKEKNRNRTLKMIRPILYREYLVKGLQLILYPYPFLLTTLNENNNKEKITI